MTGQGFIPCINLLLSSFTNNLSSRKVFNKCWLRTYNDIIKKTFILSFLNILVVIRGNYEEKLIITLLIT